MLDLKSVDLKKEKIETLVIPVCEDKEIHDNRTIASIIKQAKKIKGFKGKKDDEVIFYNPSQVSAERVVFSGIGKSEKINAEVLRSLAGRSVKKCIKNELSKVLIAVPPAKKIASQFSGSDPEEAVLEAMLSGACLGNHFFDKYKKEKKRKPLKQISFLVKPETAKKFRMLPSRVRTVCQGTILAREWVTISSNDKKPEQFIKSIVTAAEKENLKVTVMDEKELIKKKFGAILAVASGSMSGPGMVILEYKSERAEKTIALAGKGVTFDSGGINLKPSASMGLMKKDMAGAAAVAATLITLAKLKPCVNVVGIIPVVENMPSGNASRPGDIIRTYSGKTVEIGNTDAEGRLILADAISYVAEKYAPDTLIDIATLTGACVTALGDKIAGVFSSDDDLAKEIVLSGEKTHERCWQMPLPDDYKEMLKSDIADTNNMARAPSGGAITAALFLSEFVEDTRWAHIDIAGTAYIKKENAYCGPGGTGFGVRLLCHLLTNAD
ncbi:MAG: leucyl aminopeptidase [Desulfobacterales bacterium]|nr:leucyl aminopeptidase [Desulfobacterales bacterium]